ncbi:hypothetical protein, partial [Nonomuraea antimicrobica]|uniref:hypothetical protein n=1 Tax=Nonomuraea antimicrobica TaxID=561173 RepID=UPI0031E96E29
MGNTPDQQVNEMADALVRALNHLQYAATLLPVPIKLAPVVPGMAAEEIAESIKQFRKLLEEEPVTEDIKYHYDEAALNILAALDITRIAVNEIIDWRYDGVHMVCTNSINASTLGA